MALQITIVCSSQPVREARSINKNTYTSYSINRRIGNDDNDRISGQAILI